MSKWKAIAAMAENRVIGAGGKIPWHLPEDFKWFKETTMGHMLVMGRKTFESIGRALPGRTTVVLTRHDWSHFGVHIATNLDQIKPERADQTVFVAGGAEIYAQTLTRCTEILLTVVKREVEGDVLFPEFERGFQKVLVLREVPAFRIERWVNRSNTP